MPKIYVHLPNELHNQDESFSFDITGNENLIQFLRKVFKDQRVLKHIDKHYQEEIKNPHKFEAIWEDMQPVNLHTHLGSYFKGNEEAKSLHIQFRKNQQGETPPSLLYICSQDAMLYRVLKSSKEMNQGDKNLIICSDHLRAIKWQKSMSRWSTLRVGRFQPSTTDNDKRLVITSSDIIVCPLSQFSEYHPNLSAFLPAFCYLWFDLSDTNKLEEFYKAFEIIVHSIDPFKSKNSLLIVSLAPFGWNLRFYKESMEKMDTGKQLVIHKPKNESSNIRYWQVDHNEKVNSCLNCVEQLILDLIRHICKTQISLPETQNHKEPKLCLIRILSKVINETNMEEWVDHCLTFALQFGLYPYILGLSCLKSCIHSYYIFETYPSLELLQENLFNAFQRESHYTLDFSSSFVPSEDPCALIFDTMQMRYYEWKSETQIFNALESGPSPTHLSKISVLIEAMRTSRSQRAMVVIPDHSIAQNVNHVISNNLYEYTANIVPSHMLTSNKGIEYYNELMETRINTVIVSNEYFDHNLINLFAQNLKIDHIFRLDSQNQGSYTLSLSSSPAIQHLIINPLCLEQRTFSQEEKFKQQLHSEFEPESHTCANFKYPLKRPFTPLNISTTASQGKQPTPMELSPSSLSSDHSSVISETNTSYFVRSNDGDKDKNKSQTHSNRYPWNENDAKNILYTTWKKFFDCAPPYKTEEVSSGKGSSAPPHYRTHLDFIHERFEPIHVTGHGTRKKVAQLRAAQQMCIQLYRIHMLEFPSNQFKTGKRSNDGNSSHSDPENVDLAEAKHLLSVLIDKNHLAYKPQYKYLYMRGPEHNPEHTVELTLVPTEDNNTAKDGRSDMPRFQATENSRQRAERCCAQNAVIYLRKQLALQ